MALKDSYKFGRNFKFWMHARDTSIPGNLPDARVLIGSLMFLRPLLQVFFVPAPSSWIQSGFPFVPSSYLGQAILVHISFAPIPPDIAWGYP